MFEFLDLDRLNTKKSTSKTDELFNEILQNCHKKIEKLNKQNIKSCYYLPPKYIVGHPTFNYSDLLLFIMKSLDNNGIYVEWSNNENSIYISWHPNNINYDQYMKNKEFNLNKNAKYVSVSYNNGKDYIPINLKG